MSNSIPRARGPPKILSLPDELLIDILCLCLDPKVDKTMFPYYWQTRSYGSYPEANGDIAELRELPIIHVSDRRDDRGVSNVQVLRVCRRFYVVGVLLLYQNTVFIRLPPHGPQTKGYYQMLTRQFSNAMKSLKGEGLLKKLVFVNVGRSIRHEETHQAIASLASTLAEYQPCYDSIVVWRACDTLRGRDEFPRHIWRTLSQLGGLHAKKVSCYGPFDQSAARELTWCIERPSVVRPPSLLLSDLQAYLSRHVNGPGCDTPTRTESQNFIEQGQQAIQSFDMFKFARIIHNAMEFAVPRTKEVEPARFKRLERWELGAVLRPFFEAERLKSEARRLVEAVNAQK